MDKVYIVTYGEKYASGENCGVYFSFFDYARLCTEPYIILHLFTYNYIREGE